MESSKSAKRNVREYNMNAPLVLPRPPTPRFASTVAMERASSSAASIRTLSCTVPQLFERAAAHLGSGADFGSFVHLEHIQREATKQVEERAFTELHSGSLLLRRTLLVSCTAAHSATYLSVLPVQPSYRMCDFSLRLVVRHRLGLLSYESLARQSCVCRSATAFAPDPDYFHSCEQMRRTFLMQRHSNIVQTLLDFATNAGFTAICEPSSHVRQADQLKQTAKSPLCGGCRGGSVWQRGDRG